MKKKKVYNWKEIGFLCSIGFFPLLNFIIFYLYLHFDSFLLAFQNIEGGEVVWTLQNFKTIFKLFSNDGANSELVIAIKNTAIWCAFNIIIYIPSMLTTYFLYKKIRFYKYIAFVSMLPGLLPAAAYTGFVKYILSARGVLGYLAENVFNTVPVPLLTSSEYATKTMVIYSFWMGLGINFVWSGAMHSISPEIIEAGKIDGTDWFKELIHIIIPLMWPTLSVSIMFTVAGILGATGPILLFTQGNYGTTTLNYWIYKKVAFSREYYLPATIGLLMSVISIPLVFIVKHFSEKIEVY